MTKKSPAHDTVSWAKQRLDDLDATISEVERATDKLKGDARAEAEAALARLKASQAKVQGYYEQLRAQAAAVKGRAEEAQDTLEAEWVEVESAFQSFLSAAKGQADTVRDIIAARAEAQRKSWETSFKELRGQAEGVVDKARGEFDAAIKRLSDQAEKFQSRIGEAKDAGDESWGAVKEGLAEARAAHDRTIEKIRGAFSKLL